MNAYQIFLSIHALLRWVVLFAAIYALFRAYSGWMNKKPINSSDNFAGLLFTASIHLQLVVGLVLYIFLSPFTQAAFRDFGAAMKDSSLRYWAVEHILINIIAVVIITIGRAKSKRGDDVKRHKNAAIFYTIGIVLIVLALLSMAGRSGFRLMP